MPMSFFTRRDDSGRQPVPVQLTDSARTLARRPAKQLMVVSKRTQPAAVYITRLTGTATFAYLIALLVPAGTSRPVLAPLTALLVLQASLFQTIRSALRKVVSVTAGVLVAVGVSAFVGFSWWLLALLIGGALTLGYLLRLGDDLLEVPISAMLIFASAGEHAAASGRVVDTLVGSAAGLVGGLAFAPLKVQSAREAVGELANRLAGQLDRMAADLAGIPAGETPDPARFAEWLHQTRALRGEIEHVDDTLRQAEDSARLNPRTLRTPGALPVAEVALRGGLETLEHAAVTLRGLARSMLDSSRTPTEASPIRDEQTRTRLASVLTRLGEAIRAYSRLVQTLPSDPQPLESELTAALEDAHRQQDLLADILEPRTAPEGGASEWPMRGEILAHVDRLRTGLQVDLGEIAVPPARRRQPGRVRARLPAAVRLPRRRQVARRARVAEEPKVADERKVAGEPRIAEEPQVPERPQAANEIDPRDITPTR
jgi:Fusaric acid resistance protein-like